MGPAGPPRATQGRKPRRPCRRNLAQPEERRLPPEAPGARPVQTSAPGINNQGSWHRRRTSLNQENDASFDCRLVYGLAHRSNYRFRAFATKHPNWQEGIAHGAISKPRRVAECIHLQRNDA